ncbi:bifunctional nuclease family protein [Halorarius halobius]|uniref:bifunctional nuclease family protein n=1 Tax=Halorarius halobius TaxID=2962671 RepID=UPI0020CF3C3A|nr:bifunctional nuclease family protein [Halorarius halobius]
MEHDASVRGLGLSESEEGEGTPVVLLDVREEVVPIFISRDQAQSIQHALAGEPFDRPLTHDLLLDVLAEFGGALDRVRVDDLADGTFLAKVDAEQYLDGRRKKRTFDARPSDAIALALREGCPIVVADGVVDRAGRPSTDFEVHSEG